MTKQKFIEQFHGTIALNESVIPFPYSTTHMFQFRRGTALDCSYYVGRLNEMIYSTDDKTLHLCDGETPGGIIHLKLAEA